MIQRGLKLWSTNTDAYYDEAQHLYAEGLFDYVELYVIPSSSDSLPRWRSLGIPFILHAPHFAHGFNLAKREKESSNRAIYEEVRLFADRLEAPYIIFHGGIDGCIEETARQLDAFREPRALIENKPLIALPNKMGGERCRGFSPEEITLVRETAHCGFCLDFGHAICSANAQGIEPYAYIDAFMTLSPAMYHLTDVADMSSVYDAHLHLGKGELDIPRLFSLLRTQSDMHADTSSNNPSDGLFSRPSSNSSDTSVPLGIPVTFETEKNSRTDLNDFKQDMLWMKNLL